MKISYQTVLPFVLCSGMMLGGCTKYQQFVVTQKFEPCDFLSMDMVDVYDINKPYQSRRIYFLNQNYKCMPDNYVIAPDFAEVAKYDDMMCFAQINEKDTLTVRLPVCKRNSTIIFNNPKWVYKKKLGHSVVRKINGHRPQYPR